MRASFVLMGLAVLAVSACASEPIDGPAGDEILFYEGAETRLLDNDLVSFLVAVRNPVGPETLEDYARCVAAQYTLIRGYGFARHVRTLVDETTGIWRADAVYTISPALPQGESTIDAEVTVADCQLRGIPTV